MGSRQGFWKTKTVEVWQDNVNLDFLYHLQVEKGMQVRGGAESYTSSDVAAYIHRL